MNNSASYKTPSNKTIENRREFYQLRREKDERIENWLHRLQQSVNCCDFPRFVVEYLLIDRFICELVSTEMATIQSTWSLKQISEHLNEFVKEKTASYKSVSNNVGKCFKEDPSIEIFDDENSSAGEEILPFPHIDTRAATTTIETTSTDSEEELDGNHELVTDGMQCEFEDYEYSADAAVIYENVDDANFGTPHSNADGPIESTQTKNVIECIMCDEELPNQEALDEHLRNIHNEVVNHRCPHCLTAFLDYNDLLKHFDTHSGKKRLKCELCTQWFILPRELNGHTRREHSTIQRINCLDCGKITKSRKHFIVHFTTKHLKDHKNAFHCCLCDRAYETAVKLASHLERVHQKRCSHSCRICHQSFSSRQMLAYHSIRVHTDDRHTCNQCGQSYKSKEGLRRHEKDKHHQ